MDKFFCYEETIDHGIGTHILETEKGIRTLNAPCTDSLPWADINLKLDLNAPQT